MPRGERPHDSKTRQLFDDLGPKQKIPKLFKRLRNPIWTEHKSRLIQLYLKYFVFVTKNGAYIDGFAGPQAETDDAEHWSARLVMESEPRWLRKFFLFDAKDRQVKRLQQLRASQPVVKGRRIEVIPGDFNIELPLLLEKRPISDREATFALLDQRTFQCEWATVAALAKYKPPGASKIELFYFLPNGWLDRSLAAVKKNVGRLRAWWGGDGWERLRKLRAQQRADFMCERFGTEFGYQSVVPWSICERDQGGGRVMYFMIHATDHPEAPALMARAYRNVVKPKEQQQLSISEVRDIVRSGKGL